MVWVQGVLARVASLLDAARFRRAVLNSSIATDSEMVPDFSATCQCTITLLCGHVSSSRTKRWYIHAGGEVLHTTNAGSSIIW